MERTFENGSISKIIPPAKKIFPAPKFISNKTYGDGSPIITDTAGFEGNITITINKGVTPKKYRRSNLRKSKK